ncbi:hypothetical protein AMELA_G00112570, partial [Ameiurus melas]
FAVPRSRAFLVPISGSHFRSALVPGSKQDSTTGSPCSSHFQQKICLTLNCP